MSCPHKHHDEEAVAVATAAVEETKSQPTVWRSLEEAKATARFEEHVHREFAPGASEWLDPVSRRNFLKVMGAGVALATASAGCIKYPEEAIVPYVVPPEEVIPGIANFYATAMPIGDSAWPLIVESHEGRPTKVEGNPDHPASLGSTTAMAQASVLQLYDPDRSQGVMFASQLSTWTAFDAAITKELAGLKAKNGQGLRLLTTAVTSPTLAQQIRDLLAQYPQAKWHQYDACVSHSARRASMQVFGRAVNTIYRFDQAKRIVSLDADFLSQDEPGSLIYARQFINGRRLRKESPSAQVTREILGANWHAGEHQPGGEINRLYVVETNYTITGAMADHRMAVRPSAVEAYARAIAARLGAPGVAMPEGVDAAFADAVAEDLRANAGASIVIAGRHQTPAVHALAAAINEALGNVGKTVVYTETSDFEPVDHLQSITELTNDINAGQVEVLVVIGGNPAYDAPAELGFQDEATSPLKKVRLVVRYGLYYDETSFLAHWHLPASHYLEAWSDARSYEGTTSIVQPLITPLYGSRSAHELLATLNGQREISGYTIVRGFWEKQRGNAGNFEAFWRTALNVGFIEGSAPAPLTVRANAGALAATASNAAGGAGSIEVSLRPDPSVGDGAFANNAWLQELPKPITKLTWDNAAIVSPETAKQLGVDTEGLVEIQANGKTVKAPVWVMPGHADGAITLHLGYGRWRAGRVGGNHEDGPVGVNAYVLRTAAASSHAAANVAVVKGRYPLASTQLHQDPQGRDLIRVESAENFAKNEAHFPDQHGYIPGTDDVVHVTQEHGGGEHAEEAGAHGNRQDTHEGHKKVRLSLYPEYDYDHGHRWGMTIDNNACIGCNACVIACQAENNIPTVGKDQVTRYREMHWLRIDTYHVTSDPMPNRQPPAEGEHNDASAHRGAAPLVTVFEPMLCQHCEHAPCEQVCPVNATTHSAEGINEMTYNRCVGTRYCSNNCPYKVRRFNFLSWTDYEHETVAMQKNPNVTVRMRGVMEKCTYCIQRINRTRIGLKKLAVQADLTDDGMRKQELREQVENLMAGLQSACQQACPTEAILFGDLNWKGRDGKAHRVLQLKQQPQSFGVLTELNTQPRTTYMARFRNPNPKLEPSPVVYPVKHEPAAAGV